MTYKEYLKGHLNRMGLDLSRWNLETDLPAEVLDEDVEMYEVTYRNTYDGSFTIYAEIQHWPSSPSGWFLITLQMHGD